MALRAHWKRVPIRETYLGLFDGPHATPKPSSEGPVFLGIGNLTDDGHLDLGSVRHIAEDDFPKWTKRVEPSPGDIVFTYEATLNRYAIIPEGFRGCLGRRLALIRPNPAVVDTRFLHYCFFGADWRSVVASNILSGATVERIPLTTFPDFPISLPPLNEQRRIAAILSAYDDLIENNTRRIAILEEMARRIYEEWFVHFRFPGHEHVRMVESELGPVPAGWAVAPVSTIATRIGQSMSPSAEPNETFEHFSLPAFDASHRPAIESGSAIMSSKLELDSDVVLLSKLNPRIKRIWIVTGKESHRRVCSTEFLPYKAKAPFTPWFLFLLFDSDRFQSRYVGGAVGTSTSHQRVKPADVDRINVLVPDTHVIGGFDRIAAPMLQLADSLRLANINLRTTRDLLLPKLISGELDVSELREPEAVAA